MTKQPALPALIKSVRRTAPDDLSRQLAAAVAAAARLGDRTGEQLLCHFIDRCRRSGQSWQDVTDTFAFAWADLGDPGRYLAGPIGRQLLRLAGETSWERFSDPARDALNAAAEAAEAAGHPELDAGHVLLGLYSDDDFTAARVLAGLGVSRARAEAALQAARTADDPHAGDGNGQARSHPHADAESCELRMSGQAQNIMLEAVRIAADESESRREPVGTVHLLLALYGDPSSLAVRVLTAAGAGIAAVQASIAGLPADTAT